MSRNLSSTIGVCNPVLLQCLSVPHIQEVFNTCSETEPSGRDTPVLTPPASSHGLGINFIIETVSLSDQVHKFHSQSAWAGYCDVCVKCGSTQKALRRWAFVV